MLITIARSTQSTKFATVADLVSVTQHEPNYPDLKTCKITYIPFIKPFVPLRSCFRRSFHSRHLLVERQDVGHGTQRRDGERVDLAVTLGVMLLDVRELRRAAKSLVVPVQVAHPPFQSQLTFHTAQNLVGTYLWRLGYPLRISRRLHLKCWT